MTAAPGERSDGLDLEVTESDPEVLAALRHLLDMALQPLDKFGGFEHIEQFGLSGLRYQLNYLSYALSLSQYTRTPAFTGYLAEAQANAIVKMTDRRVWSYWAAENLLGYQRWNPDPIVRRNVMYTGFFGAMIGMYETLNDDSRFDQSGSLTLEWNRKTRYPYDFPRITAAIQRNMLEVPDCPQYCCEPRLVYPMCNTFAINTLRMHDRLHGTQYTGDLIERMRASYDKHWLTSDDRFNAVGTRAGTKLFPPIVGHDAVMVAWLNPFMPDQSVRTWNTIRSKFIEMSAGDVRLKSPLYEKLDPGNYKLVKGDVFSRTAATLAATEMGDDEVATALAAAEEKRNEVEWRQGARRFAGVSNWSNAQFVMAMVNRRGGMRDLVNGVVPSHWQTGPILAQAGYPEVLVARAVTDGRALDLVLRPGDGQKRTKLGIARLVPNSEYRVTGALANTITADESGRALVEIDLGDRLEVRLQPA